MKPHEDYHSTGNGRVPRSALCDGRDEAAFHRFWDRFYEVRIVDQALRDLHFRATRVYHRPLRPPSRAGLDLTLFPSARCRKAILADMDAFWEQQAEYRGEMEARRAFLRELVAQDRQWLRLELGCKCGCEAEHA